MKDNPELDLAWAFINDTSRNVFLTGKAGTGKTTFLHKLKNESYKRLIVVAPTGVAAINAKGVTIHSFFQMPFGPLIPGQEHVQNNNFNRKFSKTKIDIIKSLDLLIIDEVSMVRADLLDGIDQVLKRYRKNAKAFGGVQVLMIGDLQQLSPVIKDHEWNLLKSYYKTGYFFSSQVFQSCEALTIELKHIYRQDNEEFIQILNEVRNNALTQSSADELNKRYIKDFKPNPSEGYIYLTTHNRKAEQVNLEELKLLPSKLFSYKAEIGGKFPEHAFPNDELLELKVGAQVMFNKNDSSIEKRYFNGKIGKVIKLNKDEVVIRCPEDDFDITTSSEVWENITYTVDKESKAIKEDKIGFFKQIPLRLAWAITIHKSQGLTFEKAIIDSQGAFAHGQTYVALSRCKSLEGLILKNKIDSSQIINDNHITSFTKYSEESAPNESILEISRKDFQLDAISDIFNFHNFLYPISRLLDIYYKNRNSIEGELDKPLTTIKDQAIIPFLKIKTSFKDQLKNIGSQQELPENNPLVQERFTKAIQYFKQHTEDVIVSSLNAISYTTDNKEIEKDLEKHIGLIEELLEIKLMYFKELSNGFSSSKFLELRAKSAFITKEKPKKKRKTVIEGTSNVELFELLRTLRNDIATENNLLHYQIFNQKSLYEMCETLPTSQKELLLINGMGKVRVEKYGGAILEVISDYCDENNIDLPQDFNIEMDFETTSKKKVDTKKVSLDLFKAGKSIHDIADERGLNENTIFGHLANFIPSKEIKITDLMSETHYKELKEIIPKITFENLSDLKHQLDEKYSYGEIRLVLENLNN
ncbi:helix-turn-helix domain-containing protein [Xanthomarina sp. F2636L]|uniref:helix-turn-helix domain-containing protein n=1 Tax=Xanthomarina sp. F2636L TaxID=2996018 RepID=UPI00225E5E0B|nr:helix-turn-helix domain-containing protein [Xanthomarina sp. F2636L]MCX7552228.1 helix-turn-helix domain-containing protein [Xanthomarina sp. F2636L]